MLPIKDLPKGIRKAYQEFLAALDARQEMPARKDIGIVLEHYVGEKREMPAEIEINYARLIVLELTTRKNDRGKREKMGSCDS